MQEPRIKGITPSQTVGPFFAYGLTPNGVRVSVDAFVNEKALSRVLRAMKGDAALRSVPVVMLTSSREEGDLVQSYELGVNAYVVKPVDFGDFMNAVSQLGGFWALINEAPPTGPAS